MSGLTLSNADRLLTTIAPAISALYPSLSIPVTCALSLRSIGGFFVSSEVNVSECKNLFQNVANLSVTYFGSIPATFCQGFYGVLESSFDILFNKKVKILSLKGVSTLCKFAGHWSSLTVSKADFYLTDPIMAKMNWVKKQQAGSTYWSSGLLGIGQSIEFVDDLGNFCGEWSNTTNRENFFKGLSIAVKAILAYSYFSKAHAAYQTLSKLQEVVQRCFVIMRVAAHEKDEKLTEQGEKRLCGVAEKIVDLSFETGAEEIQIIHSGRDCAKYTAEKLAEEINYELDAIEGDGFIPETSADERLNGTQNRKLRKEGAVEGFESGPAVYQRVSSCVAESLNKVGEDTLLVFVTHQETMLDWLRGLVTSGASTEEQIPADWTKHHPTSCEIYPMQQVDGVISQLTDRTRP